MSFRNAFGIYQALEKALKSSDRPLTCVELFDSPDIKRFADDSNRVSDYLGHMWRRGLLKRFPAPKTDTSSARFAYTWKDQSRGAPSQRNVQPRISLVSNGAPHASPASKPSIELVEAADGVTINLAEFSITIKRR